MIRTYRSSLLLLAALALAGCKKDFNDFVKCNSDSDCQSGSHCGSDNKCQTGEAKAKSVSIVLHLVLFAPAFFFGLYYFLRSDVSLARLRGLAATEADEARGAALTAGAPPPACGVAGAACGPPPIWARAFIGGPPT